MLQITGSDELSGRIRIRLGSLEDVRLLETAIHSMAVSIGGELVAIKVSNAVLQPLPRCGQGNGQGRRQPRNMTHTLIHHHAHQIGDQMTA